VHFPRPFFYQNPIRKKQKKTQKYREGQEDGTQCLHVTTLGSPMLLSTLIVQILMRNNMKQEKKIILGLSRDQDCGTESERSS